MNIVFYKVLKIVAIGGENIYKDFISQNLIDYIHLTIIEDTYICDKHFDFNQNKYKLIELNENEKSMK